MTAKHVNNAITDTVKRSRHLHTMYSSFRKHAYNALYTQCKNKTSTLHRRIHCFVPWL